MIFSQKIIKWYQKNKRHLPWREINDPYKIWLSEIILQQTRIEQGLDYYLKFINHYPNIQALAAASETDVLKLWQGLGYYSRARNLHITAREIQEKWNGRFPENYDEIIGLDYYLENAEENIPIWFNVSLHFGAPPENSIICGYITDMETNEPIENAELDFSSFESWNYTKSDSSGYYMINVAAGSHNFWTHSDNHYYNEYSLIYNYDLLYLNKKMIFQIFAISL